MRQSLFLQLSEFATAIENKIIFDVRESVALKNLVAFVRKVIASSQNDKAKPWKYEQQF